MEERDKKLMEEGGKEYTKLSHPQMYEVQKKGMEDKDFYMSKEAAMCELLSTGMVGNARTLAKLAAFMANKGKFGDKTLM